MSKLKVYKASAGSGKTFKLAEEYLLMLFRDHNTFKSILAVTFTNKATAEMKHRILENLFFLSVNKKSPYKEIIQTELGVSDKEIENKATFILKLILHDYSRLAIETIDSFFQKILRAFTKDVGFYSGFTIELNSNLILNESIETLLTDKIKQNKKLHKWVGDFIKFRLDAEKSWNIRFELQKLGKEIFKEKVQNIGTEFWDKIADEEFIRAYEKILNEIIHSFENKAKTIALEAINIIQKHLLEKTDFKGKSRSFINIFYKIKDGNFDFPNNTTLQAADDIEKWYGSDKNLHPQILSAFKAGANNALIQIIQLFHSKYVDYRTAKSIIAFFYALGIIGDLATTVKEITKEKNLFLLSDASYLLKSIIGENDSPFIYEKTGTFFKSFMIDEFQDTSRLQWENFKPLILNSISEGNNSLVVGDVKQSIYRWRNGDWTILGDEINRSFTIEEINLSTNYRSDQQIIAFNNDLFDSLPKLLQTELSGKTNDVGDDLNALLDKINIAYQKPEQNYIESKADKGYVNLNFLEADDYDEKLLVELPEKIIMLQDKGYKARDIAILVRRNIEGQKIANILLSHKKKLTNSKYCFDVISNDSLFVKQSPAVQLILSVLRHLENPAIKLYKMEILANYFELQNKLEIFHEIDKQLINKEDFEFESLMPEGFVALHETSSYVSLFQLVEKIIAIFEINQFGDHNAYIISFLDIVSDFANKNYIDIPTFLEFWELNKNTYTIQAPDDIEAIKILTIHKSKGLQFKAVILPYVNWKLGQSRVDSIIWCKPSKEPFNQLPLVPIVHSSKLKETIFGFDYFYEELQNYIDSLNMLYVAFTRAEEVLITYAPIKLDKRSQKSKSPHIGEMVLSYLENFKEVALIRDNDGLKCVLGELRKTKKETDTEKQIEVLDKYLVFESSNRMKMALHSDAFFESGISDKEDFVQYGNLMHNILAEIKTYDDIKTAIDQFVVRGEISSDKKDDFVTKFETMLRKPEIKDWFSDKYEIKNEASILLKNGHTRRPDRIMINDNEAIVVDYKFSHEENIQYHIQVNKYIELLENLGYKKVTGFIWYIFLDKLVKI